MPNRILHVGLFSITASIGMVFALIADIQDELGFSTVMLGVIASCSFFSAVVSQIFLAPLADRGQARWLLVTALIVAAGAALMFATADSAGTLIMARVIAGLALGAYSPAARAIVSAADPDRAGERLGALTGVETSGFVIGPFIGAGIATIFDNDVPFIILALILLVIAPVVARSPIPEVDPATAMLSNTEPWFSPARRILNRRAALAGIILSTALYLPAGMYEAIWARFLTDLGSSKLFIGMSLTMYGIPFAITATLSGRYIDRYGPWRVVTVSLITFVPLTAVYGLMTSPVLLMTLASLEAICNGVSVPAAQVVVARASEAGERAAGQGLAAASGQMGAGIAALVAAPAYAGQGPAWMFLGVALVAGGLGAVAIYLGRADRLPSHTAFEKQPSM